MALNVMMQTEDQCPHQQVKISCSYASWGWKFWGKRFDNAAVVNYYWGQR